MLLTADHGFTYGPGMGSETRGQQRLDGRHRCAEVTGKPAAQDLEDESLVYLDKARLSLPKSYLTAVGRHFGRDTVSGGVMSHGGLLPEEVIKCRGPNNWWNGLSSRQISRTCSGTHYKTSPPTPCRWNHD